MTEAQPAKTTRPKPQVPQFKFPQFKRSQIAWLAAAVFLLFIVIQSIRVITAGYVGVVFNSLNGSVQSAQEGIRVVIPFVQPALPRLQTVPTVPTTLKK